MQVEPTASSSFIDPNSVSRGRDHLLHLSCVEDTLSKMKEVIEKKFDRAVKKFYECSDENRKYNFKKHKFCSLDKNAGQNISKAFKDYLVNKVVQDLAKRFDEIEGNDDSADIQNYLLHKLGAGKYKSTEEYIKSREESIEEVHKKLENALTKLKEGSFLSKAEKEEKAKKTPSEEKTKVEKKEKEKVEGKEEKADIKEDPQPEGKPPAPPEKKSGFSRFCSGIGSFFTSIFHFFTCGCFR